MNLDGLEHFKNPAEPDKAVELSEEEKKVEEYVSLRVTQMKDYRKELKVEEEWKEADKEYIPSELDTDENPRKRFEQSDETGLRSRAVKVRDEDEDWRSNNSDPTLLAKIQTAISIIIDRNPDVVYKTLTRANEKRTALAKALRDRNWNISGAKWMWKKFIFNLAKYGWAPGRAYPRLIKFDKEVLTEVNTEDPSKNVYENHELVWYNDVDRESLDPFRTWIDEQSKPYDEYSRNEWYFEKDYSYDQAVVEFGQYGFKKFVPNPRDLRVTDQEEESQPAKEDEIKERQDLVTIGFFESRIRDLYVIRIPKLNAVLHYCPLPNDDGLLSVFDTPWVLRSADNPYGISLWRTIKQKKTLYDKMQNMTMDQLVLSIMKMFFYTGTNNLINDGKIKIKPGKGVQIINGKVDWMEVPGPGKEAFEGLQFLKNGMDDDSGISPTLQGQVTGQTLGETQLAKEASLKRLKMPVENIAYAMELDSYLTLSWMAQIYSTPEVKEFASLEQIAEYEKEQGVKAGEMNPTGGIDPMTNEAMGPYQTTFFPEMSLPLEKNGDELIESRSERFFTFGKDIKLTDLKWRGILEVVPKSLITSSSELQKQGITELGSILAPILGQPPEIFGKWAKQMVLSRELDPKDWLPDNYLQYLQQDTQNSLFIQQQMPAMPNAMGMGPAVPANQASMQGAAGTAPLKGAPTVVPSGQINTPSVPGSTGQRQELTRMQ